MRGKGLPAMVWVFIAFIPWILYWSFSGAGMWKAAVTSGLVTSLILNAYRVHQRQAKAMEVVTLVFFSAHFLVTVMLGSPFFHKYDAVLVGGILAAMAWGTLLTGSPFTYQYAREDWPRAYWDDPLFRRTNEIITAVWGSTFSFNTALGALSLLRPETRPWLAAILPNLGIATGIIFSIFFPKWYPHRVMEKKILAREPYRWPAPVFGSERPSGDAEHDVIIVGAGIGGLTVGALLAHRGLKVLVLDQHYKPGGYCTSWRRVVSRNGEKLGYAFDAGVHDISGLGPRGPVRNLLQQLGIEERLNWHRMSHEYILPRFRLKVPRRVEEFVALWAGISRGSERTWPLFLPRWRLFIGSFTRMWNAPEVCPARPAPQKRCWPAPATTLTPSAGWMCRLRRCWMHISRNRALSKSLLCLPVI